MFGASDGLVLSYQQLQNSFMMHECVDGLISGLWTPGLVVKTNWSDVETTAKWHEACLGNAEAVGRRVLISKPSQCVWGWEMNGFVNEALKKAGTDEGAGTLKWQGKEVRTGQIRGTPCTILEWHSSCLHLQRSEIIVHCTHDVMNWSCVLLT